jgi:hypothetical protein
MGPHILSEKVPHPVSDRPQIPRIASAVRNMLDLQGIVFTSYTRILWSVKPENG